MSTKRATNPTSEAFSRSATSEDYGAAGLTKREWMATMLAQGLLAKGGNSVEYLTLKGIELADLIIAGLNKE